MEIKKNQIDDLNLQVTINVAAEDYAAGMKKFLNDRRKTADFKGFRKGNVPMGMIERVYGEQALFEGVNSCISDALNQVITEGQLRVIGEPLSAENQPEVEWKKGNDFSFVFDIAVAPEVKVALSKEDKLPLYNINVTEEAKKEMRANILQQLGSMQEGKKAGEDDFVIADFTQGEMKVEGAYVSVRKVEGEAHKSFLGAKAGAKFTVNVNEAFTNESDRAAMLKVKKEDLATLAPEFEVEVVNVKTFVAAEPSQEVYDQAFGEDKVHNEEEFMAAIEERLVANYKQEADYRLSKDLRDYLVKKADVKLPEAFLKRWLLKANEGKFTAEEIDKEFPAFLDGYVWQMVRESLMEDYKLKIEKDDIQEAAEAFASYQYAMYGMPNVPADMLKDYASRMLKDENQLRRIVESVEEQKIFTAVKEVITLSSKKISVDKFRELK